METIIAYGTDFELKTIHRAFLLKFYESENSVEENAFLNKWLVAIEDEQERRKNRITSPT